MSFEPKNILVTGGAGFIGSHFIILMLQRYKNIRIVNLDKLTYAADLSNLSRVKQNINYHFIHGDICDAHTVSQTLSHYKIDTVINFAAESHVDRSIENPGLFVQNNIYGTQILLQCVHKYWQTQFNLEPSRCRFHQISTDEVYGSLQLEEPAFTENSPYKPNSPYAASKAAADHLVHAYWKTYKLPTTISNCSNNYGAHQNAEKLIPKIINCCMELKPIPIYGSGINIRDWLFVDDHCNAINSILRKGQVGQNYNIGGNDEINNITLAQLICSEMDKLAPENAPHHRLITFVHDRLGHDFRYAINYNLLQSTLGWQPQIQLKNALRSLIEAKQTTETDLIPT